MLATKTQRCHKARQKTSRSGQGAGAPCPGEAGSLTCLAESLPGLSLLPGFPLCQAEAALCLRPHSKLFFTALQWLRALPFPTVTYFLPF